MFKGPQETVRDKSSSYPVFELPGVNCSFKGNDLIVQFKTGLSRSISKLFLIRSLKILVSEAKISK